MSATKRPRRKRESRKRKIIPLVAAFTLVASGCGLRGPLYLPDEGQEEESGRQAAGSTEAAEEEAGEEGEDGKQVPVSGPS